MGWVVSSTPRPHLTPGKDPVPILQQTGWASGPVWTGGKSRPHRDSIPDRPASSQSIYRLSYLAHGVLLYFGWNKEQLTLKYPYNKTLHVSDSSSVHHQEFFTVHTAIHTGLLTACSQAVSKPVWHTPLLCVQWKTPDDGQRSCPKHVEFYSKNKFEKLVHLVGFVIRLCHDARSPERQIPLQFCAVSSLASPVTKNPQFKMNTTLWGARVIVASLYWLTILSRICRKMEAAGSCFLLHAVTATCIFHFHSVAAVVICVRCASEGSHSTVAAQTAVPVKAVTVQ